MAIVCYPVATGLIGRRWKCSDTVSGQEWLAGPDYKYNGKLARDAYHEVGTISKPEEGVILHGGWGGKKDPALWEVMPMRQKPEMFKIVDENGVNIVTDFSTRLKAQKYIDYERFVKNAQTSSPAQQPEPEPEPQPKPFPEPTTDFPTTNDNVDKNGIAKLEIDGFQYTGDEIFNPNENFKSNGSYRLDFNNHNLGDSVVFGALLKVKNVDDEVAGKGGGSRHTGQPGDEEANWGRVYDIGINIKGDRIRVRQEFPHPQYSNNIVEKSLNLGNLSGKFIGYQFAKINTKKDGKDAVRLISWINMSPLGPGGKVNNDGWEKLLDVTKNDWPKGVWLTAYPGSPGRVDTIRVDEQDKTNYAYKYPFLRKVVPKLS